MRLLDFSHDQVSLTRDFTNNTPPYAILSHTWGEDDQEVTFQDLMQGVGKSKAGYEKIRFCRKQAATNGLQYVWIDTCCIDKSNSTELAEALNSMFRWYCDAAQCYVYLSDVPTRGSRWESAFRRSRWFTRGWTLQELLAPRSVVFFSGKGEPLGDKASLIQQIREVTKIPIDALQGKSLSSFSIDARLSWAQKRETKREEDKAYSLMGIFGVHMPPIYGEGKKEAFERLIREIETRNSQQEKRLQKIFCDENWFDNASTFTSQDELGTFFDLIPTNEHAMAIVRSDVNGRMRLEPDDPSKRFLRFGSQLRSKTPGYLAKFGRCVFTSDVVLGKGWSKNDQCYFDVNPVSGEVLLHDVSTRENTHLRDIHDQTEQIRKRPRQCVVLLDREWIFVIGRADFILKPRRAQDPETLTRERLSFIHQPVPEEYEGTYEGTLHRISTFDLTSVATSGHNTRLNTPFQPELGNEIIYNKVKRLGGGSQGNVYEVVDMYTGEHYACKVIQPKLMPKLGITTEKDFKLKVEAEVALISKIRSEHVLPVLYSQGWGIGHDIEIFQPVCEESFDRQIANFEFKQRRRKTIEMFHDISLGLHYIHTHNPPIIHRDVKPSNILYRQGKFLLSDFGIAKTVDDSRTLVGTSSYMAPELWDGGVQTTKLDIWALGATLIEALTGFPDPASRPTGSRWHRYLQKHAKKRPIALMLNLCPDKRPTAHEIVQSFFPDSLPAQRRRRSQSLDVRERKRRSRSQSAGVSSLLQKRSRSKSFRGK